MTRSSRGIDNDPGHQGRENRRIWRAIESLRSERRAGATTIGSGGLTIDGGDVSMLDTDGDVVFLVGPQIHGDRGLFVAREDGTEAFSIRKPLPGFAQRVGMFDRDGQLIFSESALSGGIDRPYLDIPTQPYLAASGPVNAGPHGFEIAVTSATFVPTHTATWRRHNYLTRWRWRIACSDATTAAEVRVVVNSEHLGTYLGPAWTGVRAAGVTTYTEVLSERLDLPGAYLDTMVGTVQARRTAGAGTVTVALVEARGD